MKNFLSDFFGKFSKNPKVATEEQIFNFDDEAFIEQSYLIADRSDDPDLGGDFSDFLDPSTGKFW